MSSTKPPSGTRDFLPADIRRREHAIGVVRQVYERYGFEPLETPAFENIETLLGKYGEEGNKLIFKILRRGEHEASGEADLALRYDLTVPLARVVAQYQNELPRLFKRYQIQPVWRADRPAKGRFREFYQCDIDAIGSTSPIVEVELLAAASDVLEELGFGSDFVIRLNDRRLLAALLETAGVPQSLGGEALIAIDKQDKIGRAGVIGELAARGIDTPVAERLLGLLAVDDDRGSGDGPVDRADGNGRILDHLEQEIDDRPGGRQGLDELKTIVGLARATSANEHIVVSPSLARGLSYYTGAIMEIAVKDLAGSLGGGGRYDNLIGMFLGREVPACGFSLGLERIIVVMTERNWFKASAVAGGVDVMIAFMDDESRDDALRLAGELRREGVRVEVYPEASRKFDKTLKHAATRGARLMAIFGENERMTRQVSIRNLTTRVQDAVPRDQAVAEITQRLNPEP